MPRLRKIRAVAGAVVRVPIRRTARTFLNATKDCRTTQHRVLNELLKLNDGSRFQREHGLHRARTVDDFRQRLPVADFEYFRPYIEDLKHGDHQALLGAGNRLMMFTLSSGTTAESKFIPITRRFLNDYRRGWQIWGIRALDKHRQINEQTILQLSSNFDQFRTAGNTPCGNISGLVAAMQKRIVRSMFAVPVVVSQISDT
ncbi:MAG: GH3 auxin-responsive promoter family protein, partial [Planctomycetaceae bacterium]